MKYYIIAGERSGDLHASNLIKSLKKGDNHSNIRCIGGDMMEEAGAKIFKHYKEISFMGFKEVFSNAITLLRAIKDCKKDILTYKPDVVILVDFAGFNLKIAKFAKENNIKVFYYISPKVWAWNQSRAFKIKNLVDRMFVIMPFEKEFYRKFDYEVDYVGNPLQDAIANYIPDPSFLKNNHFSGKPIVAILPGSRKQEVEKILFETGKIIDKFKGFEFVVAGVNNLPQTFYEEFSKQYKVKVVYDQTYDLLSHSTAAIVTSGTATLETALFRVPQVVVYKTNFITYKIAKNLIKVPYISLVNLIANKEVVKELIQDTFNDVLLENELALLLFNKDRKFQIEQDYDNLHLLLGGKGASETTAKLMMDYLGKTTVKIA